MKQNLQEKLEKYTKSISQQSIDPAKITKLGLTGAAAMAAIVTVPVELNSQIVCGDLSQPIPTRTTLQCVDDLAAFGYTSFCAQFDFDGDGTDELQVRYYNYNGLYPIASMYVDPLTTQFWTVELDSYFGYANFPETPTLRTDAIFAEFGDKMHIFPLSSGTGFGFIAFDSDAHPWIIGMPHPTTGQTISSFNSALPYMWGSTLDPNFVTTFVANTKEDVTNCAAPGLPVELSKFEVTAKEKAVLLEWTTESELNNAGFAIERSMDGKDFREIEFVDGKGQSNKTVEYTFEDKEIDRSGQYYYRLRQIDYNGNFDISDVITTTILSEKLTANIYPNPANNIINVELNKILNGNVKIDLYNTSGKLIIEKSLEASSSNVTFDTSELDSGIYFIKIFSNNETSYNKIIIQ